MAETVASMAAMKMLASTEPPIFLSPSQQMAGIARTASAEVFSSLVPSCPKPPLDRLLVDDGFDAEQIWQQIELLSSPLLSSLRRELKRLQREPPSMLSAPPKDDEDDHEDMQVEDGAEEAYEEEDDEEDEGEASEERDEGEEEEEEEEEDADEESEEVKDGGVEDRFLKIKELEEYLEKDEARENGAPKKKGRKSALKDDDGDNSEDEDDEDEDEGNFDFADLEADDDDDEEGGEEANDAEDARYEDFFGSKKKRGGQKVRVDAKKRRSSEKVDVGDPDDMGMDGEQGDDIEEEEDDDDDETKDDQSLSIHEKQLQNIQAKIEQMEKENLETKSWTMQGEITAAKRPKNSALEVNLDFDHKTRPPPVITDEITASLEDLIRRRIIEGHFDDVQRAPALPLKAPKERKELDEKKSQKGLAEIYEEEYAQKTGLAAVPLSSSDEQKKEASILFKRLCLKLDALSHFHFAPKPVIEDMSVQVNVPALAMEEIAPLAVSDFAMLAPEEVFQGKGDIKEAAELTQAERKRKRANKKRKFKVETGNRAAKKPRELSTVNKSTGPKDL